MNLVIQIEAKTVMEAQESNVVKNLQGIIKKNKEAIIENIIITFN